MADDTQKKTEAEWIKHWTERIHAGDPVAALEYMRFTSKDPYMEAYTERFLELPETQQREYLIRQATRDVARLAELEQVFAELCRRLGVTGDDEGAQKFNS